MSEFKFSIISEILKKATSPTKYPISSVEGIDRDILYKYVADKILKRSQELVPVDTGNLLNSGRVVKNSLGTYSVIYDCDYAYWVHEAMENKHDPPGQAKFLEDAAFDILGEFGYYVPFTFSIDSGYSEVLALHLDSLSFEDFINNLSRLNSLYNIQDIFNIDDVQDIIDVKDVILYD